GKDSRAHDRKRLLAERLHQTAEQAALNNGAQHPNISEHVSRMYSVEVESVIREQRICSRQHGERNRSKKVGRHNCLQVPIARLCEYLRHGHSSLRLAAMFVRETLGQEKVQRRRISGRHRGSKEERRFCGYVTHQTADCRTKDKSQSKCR